MKTKKSISLILALVMVLAMACGAWAVTGQILADSESKTLADDIETTVDSEHGALAYSGGHITNPRYDIQTTGAGAHGARATVGSSFDMSDGNIVTRGAQGYGVSVHTGSYANVTAKITTYGDYGMGIQAGAEDSVLYFNGEITTHGFKTRAVLGSDGTTIVTDSKITTTGAASYGLCAAAGTAVVTMTGGSITVSDDADSYSLYVGVGGTINIEDIETSGNNLLLTGTGVTNAGGTVNVTDCTLAGDIVHSGVTDDALEVNFSGSVWDGAAEASGDIGTIDINLEGSDWNITGDSNTNGKVTADSDSNIDFRGTDENIVVEIDSLAGAPGLNIKLGDELIIKNQTGNTPSTTTPDIISIVENSDGSISIIPNGDGTGNLTYQYVDENGGIQTVTIGVVSGSGVKPAGGSGGSSGCNAGLGILALLGLAFVYKKK